MPKYFEVETPMEVETGYGEIRFYKNAKRFQMSYPKWISAYDNEVHTGKTVTLNMSNFKNNKEVIALFRAVLKVLEEENG